jgi:hypothetical protein
MMFLRSASSRRCSGGQIRNKNDDENKIEILIENDKNKNKNNNSNNNSNYSSNNSRTEQQEVEEDVGMSVVTAIPTTRHTIIDDPITIPSNIIVEVEAPASLLEGYVFWATATSTTTSMSTSTSTTSTKNNNKNNTIIDSNSNNHLNVNLNQPFPVRVVSSNLVVVPLCSPPLGFFFGMHNKSILSFFFFSILIQD